MGTVTECATCGGALPRRPGRGRPPRFCSAVCKDDDRNRGKRHRRTFGYVVRHYQNLGQATVREQLAAGEALALADRFLPEPIGQERVGSDTEQRVIAELFEADHRSFQVVSHDTPLPPSGDIDHAERTGDWSAMLDAALNSEGMAWARARGYKPDLSEFIGTENTSSATV